MQTSFNLRGAALVQRTLLRPVSCACGAVAILCLHGAYAQGPASALDEGVASVISPRDGSTLDTALTAILRWQYPTFKDTHGNPYLPYGGVSLRVSLHEDLSAPFIDAALPENCTSFRLAVSPQTSYYWEFTPRDEKGPRTERTASGRFISGVARIDTTAEDAVRYANPREGAHWMYEKPVEYAQPEPLSPWYAVKAYTGSRVPRFEDVKDRFPAPIYDGHPDALDAYWYCWKTLMEKWYFAPDAPDHQAVANICGIGTWGPWGSTMVFDTAFILHFARCGPQDNAWCRKVCASVAGTTSPANLPRGTTPPNWRCFATRKQSKKTWLPTNRWVVE